jgi:phospholipid-binding lipoprotein MlaA
VTRRLLLATAIGVLAGCASTADRDPRDPFEPLNRGIYRFNDKVDTTIARPLATTYQKVVPAEVRSRVRNFFGNIGDLFIGVNNFLQGKFEDGVSDWARLAFNTTIGLFGIHDVATDMGYEKHNEDFGQTFGRWGTPSGPYLVLPILGSSTVRDGIGTGIDLYVDPVTEVRPYHLQYALQGLRLTQTRADLLDASRILEEAALDKYVFQRDAYLQRRRSLIYDGRAPREKEPEDDADKDKKPLPGEKGPQDDRDQDKKPR